MPKPHFPYGPVEDRYYQHIKKVYPRPVTTEPNPGFLTQEQLAELHQWERKDSNTAGLIGATMGALTVLAGYLTTLWISPTWTGTLTVE